MFNKALWSSASAEWETPQDVFDILDEIFHFTLDPCATSSNAKCSLYYTKEDDGLSKSWAGHRVFMNPPYGRQISRWIKKALDESQKPNTIVVCLLPARVDTSWFHDYCTQGYVWFIRGRLKFGGSKNSAPFPSMIVIFGCKEEPPLPGSKNPNQKTIDEVLGWRR